jgi:hypothetical protein
MGCSAADTRRNAEAQRFAESRADQGQVMTPRKTSPADSFDSFECHEALERAPKSRAEIERLVLCELQTADGCEGATGISIVGFDDGFDEGPNWTVAAYNAGGANDYACERALMNIVKRFQRFYELVQKH